ncbi:RNA binding [Cryptosporidium bovis]|uniref:RNA binding n=1 Tax=Cryptosporidium bovis TaxID=310047 RepID=UPI00351A2783|nr:RNA binding [Cryptosporidium bovis]
MEEDIATKEIIEEEMSLNEENLTIRACISDLKEDEYGNSSLEGKEKTSFPTSSITETLIVNKKKTGNKSCSTSNSKKDGMTSKSIGNTERESTIAESSFSSCSCSSGSNSHSKNKDDDKSVNFDNNLSKREDNKINNIATGLNRKKYPHTNDTIRNNNDFNQYNHLNVANNPGIYHGLRHIGHARSGNVNMNCLIPSAYPAPNVEIKLFVSRLPTNIDEEGLRKLFILYGKVVNITIIHEKNTGIHKGAAVVTMESIAQADFAIRELNSVKVLDELRGPLKVQYSVGESDRLGFETESCIPGVDQVKLFVGALPKNITEDEIRNIFSPYGYIDEIHIMREHQTGIGKGCAFIKYSYKEQGIFAIKLLNGSLTMSGVNRPIEIRFASKNKINSNNIRFYLENQTLSSGINKSHIPLDSKNNVIASSFQQKKNFSSNIKLLNEIVNKNNNKSLGAGVANRNSKSVSKLLSNQYNNNSNNKQYFHYNQNINNIFQTGQKKTDNNYLNVLSSPKTKQNTLNGRKMGVSYNQNQNNRRISSLLDKNGVPISSSTNSSGIINNLMHSRQKLLVLEGENTSTSNITGTGADGSCSSSNNSNGGNSSGNGNDVLSTELERKVTLGNILTRPKVLTTVGININNGSIATGTSASGSGNSAINSVIIGGRNTKLNMNSTKLSLSTMKANLMPRCIGVWKEYFTFDGRPYYYNELTKITQWEVPSEFANLISNYSNKEVVGPPGANIFIFNVPYEWNKKTLFALFYKFGTILSVHLMLDKGNKRNKGVAFVSYDNINSAAEAVNCMNGFMTEQGRRLKVSIKQGQERFVQHLINGNQITGSNIDCLNDIQERNDNENTNYTDFTHKKGIESNHTDKDNRSDTEKSNTGANYTEINTTDTKPNDNINTNTDHNCNDNLFDENGTCTKDNEVLLVRECINDKDAG